MEALGSNLGDFVRCSSETWELLDFDHAYIEVPENKCDFLPTQVEMIYPSFGIYSVSISEISEDLINPPMYFFLTGNKLFH